MNNWKDLDMSKLQIEPAAHCDALVFTHPDMPKRAFYIDMIRMHPEIEADRRALVDEYFRRRQIEDDPRGEALEEAFKHVG